MEIHEVITLIGQAAVCLVALRLVLLARAVCIMLFGKPIDFKKHGKWAVVTGATDGIGIEYADQLAEKGMDIVLISRTPSKLQAAAKEIEDKHKVETKIIAVDFTEDDIWDKLKSELLGMDIGVLINNVGMGAQGPARFAEVPGGSKFNVDMIRVNVTSVTSMMNLVMPRMVEKNKGVVVNISSTAAVAPNPLVAVYAASKAYVDFLSRAVASEYSNTGIIVQTLIPGLVDTKLVHYMKKVPIAMTTPKNFVQSALRTVGKLSYTGGYWYHEVQACQLLGIRSLSSSLSVYMFKKAVQMSDGKKK